MDIGATLDMAEVKQNFANLISGMRTGTAKSYFASYLATKIDDQMSPGGFLLTYELTVAELEDGLDGAGRIIEDRPSIFDHPFTIPIMRDQIVPFTEAIFPKEFADAVKAAIAERDSK